MKETDKMMPAKRREKRKKRILLNFFERVKKAVSKNQTLIDV